MKFHCPHCQAKLSFDVTPQTAGKPARCPSCQQKFALPQVPEAAPAPLPPAQAAPQPPSPPAPPPPPAPQYAAPPPSAAAPPPPPPLQFQAAQGPPPQAPAAPPAPPQQGIWSAPPRGAYRRARAGGDSPLKKIAAGGFAAAILAFLFPFFNITCMGETIMSMSGLALVTGGEAKLAGKMKDMMGEMSKGMGAMSGKAAPTGGPAKTEQKVDVQPLAIVALVAAVLGLALSFVPRAPGAIMGMSAAVAAIVLLVALMYKLDGDLKRDMEKGKGGASATKPSPFGKGPEGMGDMDEAMAASIGESMEGMVELKAAFGFMGTNLFLAAAGVLHLVALLQMGRAPRRG